MLRRYAFTWCFLGLYLAMEIVYVLLPPGTQDAFSGWASTSVANLEHNPVGTLLVSPFIGQGDYWIWPLLILLPLLGANQAIGNLRIALVCLAGTVIGSLVSEGIVGYRVDAGSLPVTDRHLVDVGPSYVVVAATMIALILGPWLARLAAAFVFSVMIFIGDIFSGLSNLDVAAVGHLTAAVTGTACAAYLLLSPRRGRLPGRSGR